MMKKSVAIILAFVMLFGFASCVEENEFTLGTADGNTYENGFIGIGYTLDEGWSFESTADLLADMGIDASLTGDGLQAAVNKTGVIYDMDASGNDGGENVFIQVKNIGTVFGKILDDDTYIDMWQESLDKEYSGGGEYDEVNYTKGSIDFCGKSCKKLDIHLVYGEGNIYQRAVFLRIDGYMVEIVVTSITDWDTVDGIFDNFYSLSD